MATLRQLYDFYQSASAGADSLRERALIAMIQKALAVAGELGTTGTRKAKREAFAALCLRDPHGQIARVHLAVVCLGNAAVLSEDAAGDTALSSALDTLWDDLSGVQDGD